MPTDLVKPVLTAAAGIGLSLEPEQFDIIQAKIPGGFLELSTRIGECAQEIQSVLTRRYDISDPPFAYDIWDAIAVQLVIDPNRPTRTIVESAFNSIDPL